MDRSTRFKNAANHRSLFFKLGACVDEAIQRDNILIRVSPEGAPDLTEIEVSI